MAWIHLCITRYSPYWATESCFSTECSLVLGLNVVTLDSLRYDTHAIEAPVLVKGADVVEVENDH